MTTGSVKTDAQVIPVKRRGSRSKQPSYDFEELCKQFQSLRTLAGPATRANEQVWVAAFTHRPEALEGIISDLIKQAYAKPGRIGQRPMPREEEVNLDALLHGEFTDDRIGVALPKLVKVSERAFCERVHMNRRTYQRMLLPDSDVLKHYPDMELLQRIAKGVSKPPSYFLEYRLIAAHAAFNRLILDRPVIATRLYRDYLQVSHVSPFLAPPQSA